MRRFCRTLSLIGESNLEKLNKAKILLVGIGGVGGYVLEMLVRSGFSNITIIDNDIVDISNINRQIISLESEIGKKKVEVAKRRAENINPEIKITALDLMVTVENVNDILSEDFDYCIDCFDSVKAKVAFIIECTNRNLNLISAMGAGNRINPDFKVCDINKTAYDPLAKAVRKGLKNTNVKKLKTVCDIMPPIDLSGNNGDDENKSEILDSKIVASISYAPALMGCMIAKEVINDLIRI